MFPTEILNNRTQRKILRVLSEKNRSYNYEELAQICHRSISTISRSLKFSNRYSIIEKKNVSTTKENIVGLNAESRYTTPIKGFFKTEREIERKNGTIPVTVWNLLEDYNHKLSKKDDFIELILFGSHATGEYHSRSDIDLLLVTWKDAGKEKLIKITNKINNRSRKKVQLIIRKLPNKLKNKQKNRIYQEIINIGPINEKETFIPLSGEFKR